MLSFLVMIIGFIILVKGSELLVSGSESFARKLNIPESIIGLTLVALGTSIPELFISIEASITNNSDIILGNIVGTNVTNILLILGGAAIYKEIVFTKDNKYIEIPFMIFTTVLFIGLANFNKDVSIVDSIILLSSLSIFLIYIFKTSKNSVGRPKQPKINFFKSIFYVIIGIVLLIFASGLVVDSALKISILLNLDDSIIGFTLVALGTSLPEIVTYFVASLKGDNDLAVGNIIGSNIMNITLVMGVSGLINPMNFYFHLNEELLILFITSLFLLLIVFINKNNTMNKLNGIIFILVYIGYLFLLLT